MAGRLREKKDPAEILLSPVSAGTSCYIRDIPSLVMVVIVVPVLLGFPAMFMAVPPLMILVPTTPPFGIQIAPAIFGFAAVLAVVMDCFIQSRFRFFDRMLAM